MAKPGREPPPPTPDLLKRVNAAVVVARDLRLELVDLEAKLKERAAALYRLEHEVLPELFREANMTVHGLEAQGNMPAYVAKAGPYYKANIAAEWDEERREDGFRAVEELGGEDIIRTEIIVSLGAGERDTAKRVEAGLRKARVPFEVRKAVPWNTLTAFVRELIEKKKTMPPLDRLGATVGRVVTVKPEKTNGR